jgi:hypothetical protein
MQLASRIGLISFEKLTEWLAGGGNCATCSGVIVGAATAETLHKSATTNLNDNTCIQFQTYQHTTQKTGKTAPWAHLIFCAVKCFGADKRG